ncbi:DUF485 domain-containing protein [Streptomyces fructofermentans]|uniref:DUF485 domain-containing protein n=1 Tax=Streptomyces fructofermentans TaxID=152141 RepID=UPI0033D134E6
MSYDDSVAYPVHPHHGRHCSPDRSPLDPALPGERLPAADRPPSWTGRHRDLRILRRAYRRQRRWTTLIPLSYFSAFLALSAVGPGFMTEPLVGGLSTGLVLALSQLPAAWLAVALYERTAYRHVDPLARRVNRHSPWTGGARERER